MSGLMWHERLSDCLRCIGHKPCKKEPDTCLRDCGEHCEYITIHVDNLIMSSKDPQKIVDVLMKKHHFKQKGTGPMSYHLGCDFSRDEDGKLHFTPRKC